MGEKARLRVQALRLASVSPSCEGRAGGGPARLRKAQKAARHRQEAGGGAAFSAAHPPAGGAVAKDVPVVARRLAVGEEPRARGRELLQRRGGAAAGRGEAAGVARGCGGGCRWVRGLGARQDGLLQVVDGVELPPEVLLEVADVAPGELRRGGGERGRRACRPGGWCAWTQRGGRAARASWPPLSRTRSACPTRLRPPGPGLSADSSPRSAEAGKQRRGYASPPRNNKTNITAA